MQISEDDKKGKKIGKRVQFTGKVSVKLYEKDEEGDDYLGKRVRKPGRKDGTMKFTEDDVDYRLSYKIR